MAASGTPPASRQRIDYVDGLRAIAVLGVVMLHSMTGAAPLKSGTLLYRLVESGTHGVDLFFVISGYCLSYPTLRKLYSTGQARFDVGEFFSRRIVRIVPPYWCAFGLSLAVIAAYRHWGHPLTYGLHAPASWLQLAGQLIFVNNDLWLLAVYWTLQIEFLWYIVFPLALALWLRSPAWFIAAALVPHPVAWVMLHRFPSTASLFPFVLMLLPFMLGIVAADAFLRKPAWTRWALPAAAALTIFGMAFEAQPHMYGPIHGQWSHVQIGWQLAAFFFVVAAGSIPQLKRALAARWLTAIGVASYSIYLVHALVVFTTPFYGRGPLLGIVAIACGVVAGFAFWFVFERPVTGAPLRDRLWNTVGSVVRPGLAWWTLPAFQTKQAPDEA